MSSENAKKLFKLSLLVLFIIVAGLTQNLDAQSVNKPTSNKPKPVQDEKIDDTIDNEEEPIYSPFHKHLGIGFIIGTNTIVESYTPKPLDRSYEGLFAYGGTLHYSLLDYIIITGSYVYSKNNKLLENDTNAIPNVHRQIELTSNFLINPHNRINFFAMFGISYLMNDYAKTDSTRIPILTFDNRLGINSGIGFYINFPIKSAGTFTLIAEWKLNFSMGSTNLPYDPRVSIKDPEFNKPVELSSFFSIPRLSVVWFPEFLFEK
jgi:hypothetical protein